MKLCPEVLDLPGLFSFQKTLFFLEDFVLWLKFFCESETLGDFLHFYLVELVLKRVRFFFDQAFKLRHLRAVLLFLSSDQSQQERQTVINLTQFFPQLLIRFFQLFYWIKYFFIPIHIPIVFLPIILRMQQLQNIGIDMDGTRDSNRILC